MQTQYAAVVYDLDGTLVDLAVDWAAARTDVATALQERGLDENGASLWDLRERAIAAGHGELVEELLADHEHAGAQASTRLPLADGLPHERPVGVCSLNCEAACRLALETHRITEHVDVVVGRDSHETVKPDPGPLLKAIESLDATPENTVFVGDSERDRETADRAGTAFAWAREW